jgi:hypothetical protein
VFLTVVRSHVLVGSFGFLGFIHPHVVIANTADADAAAAETGHRLGGSGGVHCTLLELSAWRFRPP